MTMLLIGAVLLLIGVVSAALDTLYADMPLKELRRQARQGDPLAKKLYRAAVYGRSSRVLLRFVATVATAAGIAMILPQTAFWVGFSVLAVTLAVLFVGVPALRLTFVTATAAAFLAPVVTWPLSYLHAPFHRLAVLTGRADAPEPSSGYMYDEQDLIDVLHRQHDRPYNRIAHDDLEFAKRALTFDDRRAGDVLHRRKDLFLVNADDSIGPVLLDQMHSSGQKTCLVYKDKKSNLIGSLHLNDAARANHGGRVLDLVRNDLIYVHEDFTLKEILGIFHETGQHIAAVINTFEEFLGIVTLETLIKELTGGLQTEAVGNYNDRTMVAAYEPRGDSEPQEPSDDKGQIGDEAASRESTEVVQ